MSESPYLDRPVTHWRAITKELIEKHPLATGELVDVVLTSWTSIFQSGIGPKKFKIGKDIFPKPQIMGFFLHELIPLELSARHTGTWRPDKASADKDIVYVPDEKFSIEIKTSSNANKIFGNRSYAQETSSGKKAKSGYYLAVNFDKFSGATQPKIRLVRFGWLDSHDWIGQAASTGQQSRLPPDVDNNKLLPLYKG